jgi:hypothetical protein
MFRSLGLSERQAETAAAGRDMSVSEARRVWDAAGSSVVSESAVATSPAPTMSYRLVTESAAIGKSSDSRRFRARIIQGDIFGASGFYSKEVLQEAARDKVFAAGLPVGVDHPTATEMQERPTRSIRDLAGKLTTDAVYEGDGLYADVEFYPHIAPVIAAMAGDVGLSIRAMADVYQGEAAGRQGTIVSRISEALSVDVVSRAGAGGRLVSLLESVGQGR